MVGSMKKVSGCAFVMAFAMHFITTVCFHAALAPDYVYWANLDGNAIGGSNLDGSSANQSWITGCNYPWGLAWSEASSTQEVDISWMSKNCGDTLSMGTT